jgi:hypothetical protein
MLAYEAESWDVEAFNRAPQTRRHRVPKDPTEVLHAIECRGPIEEPVSESILQKEEPCCGEIRFGFKALFTREAKGMLLVTQ